MANGPYREGIEEVSEVIVSTTNEILGYEVVEYLGIVRGITVRSPSFGQSFVGSLKSLAGGSISQFRKVCEEARHEAFGEMVSHAEEVGADAVIGMRYDATEFMQGATEVLAYGTAVALAPLDGD